MLRKAHGTVMKPSIRHPIRCLRCERTRTLPTKGDDFMDQVPTGDAFCSVICVSFLSSARQGAGLGPLFTPVTFDPSTWRGHQHPHGHRHQHPHGSQVALPSTPASPLPPFRLDTLSWPCVRCSVWPQQLETVVPDARASHWSSNHRE